MSTKPNSEAKTWNAATETEKEKAKFIPKGRIVTILLDPLIQTQLDGKYGKRLMYIANSDIGKIYLAPVQVIDIAKRFNIQIPPFSSPVQYP